jgi:hypothetical protein
MIVSNILDRICPEATLGRYNQCSESWSLIHQPEGVSLRNCEVGENYSICGGKLTDK